MITLYFDEQATEAGASIYRTNNPDKAFQNLSKINIDLYINTLNTLERDKAMTIVFPFDKYVCILSMFKTQKQVGSMVFIDSSLTGAEIALYAYIKKYSLNLRKKCMEAFNQATSGLYRFPTYKILVGEAEAV